MQKQNNFGQINKKLILTLVLTLLTGLIFSIGCVQMTRAEKNLCLSLTSQSYSYVPLCETESECFKKIDSLFETNLSYSQENQLYSFKNYIARSWFFYNKAIRQVKKINTLCETGNAQAISSEIYQLKFFLATAFDESDKAMEKSFEIISYEEEYLTKEKIDLLKEEKIFDSLLNLRQIISELKSGPTNSETYVSFYLNKISQFNEMAKANNIPIIIEENYFWLKKAELIQEENKDFSKTNGLFPFISPTLEKIFEYFEFNFYLKQNSLALQKMPSSQTMKLYSDLFGENNSSLKRFVDLSNNLSHGHELLIDKTKIGHLEVAKQIDECNMLIEKTDEKKEFNELAQKITNSKISTQKSITSRLENAKASYIGLKQKIFQNKSSLGEEIFWLKELNAEFKKISLELKLQHSIYFEQLEGACDAYAKERTADNSVAGTDLESLFQEINFLGEKTLSSKGEEKLLYCDQLYEKNEAYLIAKDSLQAKELELKNSAKECLAAVEGLLKLHPSEEIGFLLSNLLKSDVSKSTLPQFNESCNEIRAMLEAQINEDFEIVELKNWFGLILDLEQKYNAASVYLGEDFSDVKSDFHSKLDYYKNFVLENGEFNLIKLLPEKSKALAQIKGFEFNFNQKLTEQIISYFKKNKLICLNSQAIIETGKESFLEYSIIFYNPFWEINSPFQIYLDDSFDSIISSDPCISNIILGKPTTIVFECFPKGHAQIILGKKELIEFIETDFVIRASNQESLIKKELVLKKKNLSFESIMLKIKKPPFYTNSIAMVKSTEFPVYEDENNNIFVKINNLFSEDKVTFFIYLSKAVSLEKSFIKSEASPFGEELFFKIETQNLLMQKIKADLFIEIMPEFSQNNEINLLDSAYEKVPYSLENNALILKSQAYEGFERKDYLVKIIVSDSANYLKTLLLNQKDLLYKEQKFLETEKINEFLKKNPLDLREGFSLVEKNKKILDQIEIEKKTEENINFLIKECEVSLKVAKEICEEYSKYLTKEFFSTCTSLTGKDFSNLGETALKKELVHLENFLLEVKNHFLEKANSSWEKMASADTNSKNLEKIREAFFNEKINFSKSFSTVDSSWAKGYKKMDLLYLEFVQAKDELEKNSLLLDKNAKKNARQIYLAVAKLFSWIEDELAAVDYENNPLNYLLPLPLSRIKIIKSIILDSNQGNDLGEEKLYALNLIYEELAALQELSKKSAIKEFNYGIDNKIEKETLLKAKNFIDENKHIQAFFALAGKKPAASIDLLFLAFLPFLFILGAAYLLKLFSRKKEAHEESQKKAVENSWED